MTCWTGCSLGQAADRLCLAFIFVLATAGCEPTVRVEASPEPITINLNVKIEHEVRVKLEKDIEELLSEDDELF